MQNVEVHLDCNINEEDMCVLVVDDDVDVLESVIAILELETSYRIISATNKDEVEKLLQNESPNIALLDIQLGQFSGLDLIPILRRQIEDIICTMITAYRDVEYAVKAVRMGADEYLFKPIEPDKLLKHIHTKLCEQHAARKKEILIQEERYKNKCDVLTGLPGRELLDYHLDITLASASRSKTCFAVIFIDLDHFKQLNDTLGHQAGDELLISAAQKMRSCLRDEEILSRLGGDEFVIVLKEGVTIGDAQRVAKRLVESIASIPMKKGQPQRVTSSIGIALYPKNGRDSATLLNYADQAMYKAKNSGKNCFSF